MKLLLQMTMGFFHINNIRYGSYLIMESVVPTTHESRNLSLNLTLNAASDANTMSFRYNPIMSSARLSIVDSVTGQGVRGLIYEVVSANEQVFGTVTSNAAGTATINNLPFGDYEFRLTNAGQFKPDINIIPFRIQNTNQVLIDLEAERLMGDITVRVTDDLTGKPVQNVAFDLRRNNISVAEGVTNSGGELLLANLPCDTYTLTETGRPSMYSANNTIETIVLLSDGALIERSNKRAEGGFILELRNLETNQLISPQTEFTLVNTELESHSYSLTLEGGRKEFTNIYYGTYLLHQNTFANGFLQNGTLTLIEVSENVSTYQVYNEAISSDIGLITWLEAVNGEYVGIDGFSEVKASDIVEVGFRVINRGNVDIEIESLTKTATFELLGHNDWSLKEPGEALSESEFMALHATRERYYEAFAEVIGFVTEEDFAETMLTRYTEFLESIGFMSEEEFYEMLNLYGMDFMLWGFDLNRGFDYLVNNNFFYDNLALGDNLTVGDNLADDFILLSDYAVPLAYFGPTQSELDLGSEDSGSDDEVPHIEEREQEAGADNDYSPDNDDAGDNGLETEEAPESDNDSESDNDIEDSDEGRDNEERENDEAEEEDNDEEEKDYDKLLPELPSNNNVFSFPVMPYDQPLTSYDEFLQSIGFMGFEEWLMQSLTWEEHLVSLGIPTFADFTHKQLVAYAVSLESFNNAVGSGNLYFDLSGHSNGGVLAPSAEISGFFSGIIQADITNRLDMSLLVSGNNEAVESTIVFVMADDSDNDKELDDNGNNGDTDTDSGDNGNPGTDNGDDNNPDDNSNSGGDQDKGDNTGEGNEPDNNGTNPDGSAPDSSGPDDSNSGGSDGSGSDNSDPGASPPGGSSPDASDPESSLPDYETSSPEDDSNLEDTEENTNTRPEETPAIPEKPPSLPNPDESNSAGNSSQPEQGNNYGTGQGQGNNSGGSTNGNSSTGSNDAFRGNSSGSPGNTANLNTTQATNPAPLLYMTDMFTMIWVTDLGMYAVLDNQNNFKLIGHILEPYFTNEEILANLIPFIDSICNSILNEATFAVVFEDEIEAALDIQSDYTSEDSRLAKFFNDIAIEVVAVIFILLIIIAFALGYFSAKITSRKEQKKVASKKRR